MSPSLNVAACESAWVPVPGPLQHLVWKVWWYPDPSSPWGIEAAIGRHDGPAIIYKGGNCRWVPHIAKLRNGDAVVEDNKK